MLKWISGLLDRICAVAGALLFSQLPLFMQQYTQQLSGHVAELRLQVNAIQQAATHSSKTLEQFIQKFVESNDPDFVRQGDIMLAMVNRWYQFSDAYTALQESSVFTRPFNFLYHLNWDIAAGTWNIYTFGIPFNLEGLIFALIGIVVGYIIYYGIRKLFSGVWSTLTFPFRRKSVVKAS